MATELKKGPKTKTRVRKPQVTKTQLRKILSECAFDPRTPGPMKVIAEMGDPVYIYRRAIEILRQTDATYAGTPAALRQAIGLLALSIAQIENAGV